MYPEVDFFPSKGKVIKYYSPRMIMHQENHDFTKPCQISFGAYVQPHNEPNQKNSQHPRTIDYIYLRYVDSMQGGHHSLDLTTGNKIKRRNITQKPITKNVINLVHTLAEANGIKEGHSSQIHQSTTHLGLQEWITMKTSWKMKMKPVMKIRATRIMMK